MASTEANSGAYRLYLRVPRPIVVQAGRLGHFRLEAGLYVYCGSARRGLQQRVARHRRLAVGKSGNRRGHIDAVLLRRLSRLVRTEVVPGGDECALSTATATRRDAQVPIARFGATDYRHGCAAHFYSIDDDRPE